MKQTGQALIYILLVVFVAAAGGGIVFTYTGAITRAEKAEGERDTALKANKDLDDDNKQLRADNAKKEKLLAVRTTQRNEADAAERRLNAALEQLRIKSQDVRAWAGQPVPADVLVGLRNERAGQPKDGKIAASGKPAGGSADSGLATDDYKLGTPRPGPRLQAPAAGVQR